MKDVISDPLKFASLVAHQLKEPVSTVSAILQDLIGDDDVTLLLLLKQRVTFYNASVILGLHGGAFSNIGFCNSNATVIEINYVGRGQRDCFCNMAIALQLNYIRFPLTQNIFGTHFEKQMHSKNHYF